MPRFYGSKTVPATGAKSADAAVEQKQGRPVPVLSDDEEKLVSGITTSEQFTLGRTLNMYAGVRSLRNPK